MQVNLVMNLYYNINLEFKIIKTKVFQSTVNLSEEIKHINNNKYF